MISDAISNFASVIKSDEDSNDSSDTVSPKYLQVALLADENVEAKHGEQTTNFLLVLANIVSTRYY